MSNDYSVDHTPNTLCNDMDCRNPHCINAKIFNDLCLNYEHQMMYIAENIKNSVAVVVQSTEDFYNLSYQLSPENNMFCSSKVHELSQLYVSLMNAAIIPDSYRIQYWDSGRKRKRSDVEYNDHPEKRQRSELQKLTKYQIKKESSAGRRYFKTKYGERVYLRGQGKHHEACRKGNSCNDALCDYSHICISGDSCKKNYCNLFHPGERGYIINSCSFRDKCTNSRCAFYHGDLYL